MAFLSPCTRYLVVISTHGLLGDDARRRSAIPERSRRRLAGTPERTVDRALDLARGRGHCRSTAKLISQASSPMKERLNLLSFFSISVCLSVFLCRVRAPTSTDGAARSVRRCAPAEMSNDEDVGSRNNGGGGSSSGSSNNNNCGSRSGGDGRNGSGGRRSRGSVT